MCDPSHAVRLSHVTRFTLFASHTGKTLTVSGLGPPTSWSRPPSRSERFLLPPDNGGREAQHDRRPRCLLPIFSGANRFWRMGSASFGCYTFQAERSPGGGRGALSCGGSWGPGDGV